MKKVSVVLNHALAKLEKFTDRPWYLPAAAGLAGLDLIILVVPTDTLIVTSAMLQPKKWIRVALWFATGSALGAMAVGGALQLWGESFVSYFTGGGPIPASWNDTRQWIHQYGALGLGLFAFGPLPVQPAIFIAGFAKMSLAEIFVSVWVGRFVKYMLFSWMGSHSPHLLRKFGLVYGDVQEEKIAPILAEVTATASTEASSSPIPEQT